MLDIAFAGLPRISRPPVYVTTHTHVRRLEVNFAMPRGIWGPDGRLRSLNPHYPHPQSREIWSAYRDLLNHRFGWADPMDPARLRELALPDWRLKLAAESRRAGFEQELDPRLELLTLVRSEIDAGRIRDRGQVLDFLDQQSGRRGSVVLRVGQDHITIGPPTARPHERMRLKGPIFSESFTSPETLRRVENLPELRVARRAELETAPQRLQAGWETRARFNRQVFGRGEWPEDRWSADAYREEQPGDVPCLIPARHHEIPPLKRVQKLKGAPEYALYLHTDGAPPATDHPANRAGLVFAGGNAFGPRFRP